MDAKICVDASFALKLVLPEADSDLAQSEWQNWLHSLLFYRLRRIELELVRLGAWFRLSRFSWFNANRAGKSHL